MGGGAQVLVVDDEPGISAFVRYALEDQGYRVLVAADGLDAVELAKDELFDLVVLDMMLPRLTGEAVAAKLRELYGPNLPILVMTADVNAAEKARRAGAFGYLNKPFDVDDLVQLVGNGLAGRIT